MVALARHQAREPLTNENIEYNKNNQRNKMSVPISSDKRHFHLNHKMTDARRCKKVPSSSQIKCIDNSFSVTLRQAQTGRRSIHPPAECMAVGCDPRRVDACGFGSENSRKSELADVTHIDINVSHRGGSRGSPGVDGTAPSHRSRELYLALHRERCRLLAVCSRSRR